LLLLLLLLLLLDVAVLQGVLPYTRVTSGDVADATQQMLASGNLEVVAAVTLQEVSSSSSSHRFLSSSGSRRGLQAAACFAVQDTEQAVVL
jgi:hypothetical protein